MDPTNATVWWACPDCGVDAEVPAAEIAGFEMLCPDCATPMAEQWRWETAA